MEQSKKCSKCKVEKNIIEFNKDLKTKDNLYNSCRTCKTEINSTWRKNNKDYTKKRRANDESFRLACNLRSRLRTALSKQVTQKNDKTEDLLGISFQEFKEYIEFLMTPEMTWKTIELDHVKALSSFNLTDIEQLKEATHYSNIQPLLKIDNLRKGSKFHEHDLAVQRERVYEHQLYKYYKNFFLIYLILFHLYIE